MDTLDKLLPKGSTESRTLADIILEKIEASEAAKANADLKEPQVVRRGNPSYSILIHLLIVYSMVLDSGWNSRSRFGS
jgi:hypothetical protein